MSQRVTNINRTPAIQPEKPRKVFAFPAEPSVHSQPEPELPTEPAKTSGKVRIRLLRLDRKLLLVVPVVIVFIAGAAILLTGNSQPDPIPVNIKQEADFTLYYPQKLPAGFRFDEAKYDASTRVVTYDYVADGGNKLYFSLQPKPTGFNFDNFDKEQLSGAHQTDTPIGTATIGILQQETVSSVVADKTWILISAGEKISLDQLEQVSKSLAPAKK